MLVLEANAERREGSIPSPATMKITIEDQEIAHIDRPSITIEEIEQPDGSYKLGEAIWEPLKTTAFWVGKKDVKIFDEKEVWTLKGAEINDGHIVFQDVVFSKTL